MTDNALHMNRRRFVVSGIAAGAALSLATLPDWSGVAEAAPSMNVGTNFWFLSSDGQCVEGGNPWTGERPFKAGVNWSTAYSSGTNVWSQTFLNEIAIYNNLRFMDWGRTNGSGVTNWSQRTSPTADQTRLPDGGTGLAYEWMIDLCNRTGKNPWYCFPLKASDDFIRQCARLWRDKLNTNRKIYIELHNELWLQKSINGDSRNTSAYAIQMANNGGYGTGDSSFTNVLRFLARRSADIWRIWSEEFGSSFGSRVVKVIAGQSANPDYGNQVLQALDNRTVNPDARYPNVYAIAPYFAAADATSPNVWNDLDSDITNQITITRDNYNIWSPRSIGLVCYEGGQHLVGTNTAAVNRDSRIYGRYISYLNGISQYLTLFNHYTHCGSYGTSGNWGAKEHTGQSAASAHKYRALSDYVNGGSSGGGGTTTLTPTHDRDNWADHSGTDPTLYASKWQTMYFKFSLSSVGSTVSSAKLRLYRPDLTRGTLTLTVHQVTNDNWNEANNASLPGYGSAITSVTSSSTGYIEFGVKDFVQAQKSGDGIVSFAVRTDKDDWQGFHSKDNGANKPQLVVTSS